MTLENYDAFGWKPFFSEQMDPTHERSEYVRITEEHRGLYRVWTPEGERQAELTGKFLHQTTQREDFPAVGDWVQVEQSEGAQRLQIHHVLERFSKISRQAAGQKTQEQIIAANVDTLFIVTSLNEDLNLRRIERYLVVAWESQALPVILLTKADLCEEAEACQREVEEVALGVPVHVVSVVDGRGIEALGELLKPGMTGAFIGSSGVGKSTLLNALSGTALQATQDVRSISSKGKHTTTSRSLFQLPGGGLIIDTPGMRELQLWQGSNTITQAFGDVIELLTKCRFRNCTHNNEPGCALQEAFQSGELEKIRFQNYQKMLRELEFQERKQDIVAQSNTKKRWKKITSQYRQRTKHLYSLD